jgi:putative transcriptional regulator
MAARKTAARSRTMWTKDRIRDLRKAFGETQEEFAKRFRVSVNTLQWWEQGKGKPIGPATVILDQLAAEVAEESASVKVG